MITTCNFLMKVVSKLYDFLLDVYDVLKDMKLHALLDRREFYYKEIGLLRQTMNACQAKEEDIKAEIASLEEEINMLK